MAKDTATNAKKSSMPKVRALNVLIHGWDTIQFPVVWGLDRQGGPAIVAVVTTTTAKIDFTISVRNAYVTKLKTLVVGDEWTTDFQRCFERRIGDDVTNGMRGWTNAILEESLALYNRIYHRKPPCMVGVFEQVNDESFWKTFKLPTDLNTSSDEDLANAAGDAIKKTPFWRPRKGFGYTRVMFDVEALRRKNVYVRAFHKDLDRAYMDSIAVSARKLHSVPEGRWVFARGGAPIE